MKHAFRIFLYCIIIGDSYLYSSQSKKPCISQSYKKQSGSNNVHQFSKFLNSMIVSNKQKLGNQEKKLKSVSFSSTSSIREFGYDTRILTTQIIPTKKIGDKNSGNNRFIHQDHDLRFYNRKNKKLERNNMERNTTMSQGEPDHFSYRILLQTIFCCY